MPKSVGVKKISVAVFISGNGSNLKSLILSSLKKNSKYEINLVISNTLNAKGLKYAKKFRIKKEPDKLNLLSWIYENFIE